MRTFDDTSESGDSLKTGRGWGVVEGLTGADFAAAVSGKVETIEATLDDITVDLPVRQKESRNEVSCWYYIIKIFYIHL